MSILLTGVNRKRWNPGKPDGLVQWLDEIDGPWFKDRANTGDDRILNGGPGLQPGRCLSFNGTTNYINGWGQAFTSVLLADFSYSFWFKCDSASSGWNPVLGRMNVGGNYQGAYVAVSGTTNKLTFRASDAGGTQSSECDSDSTIRDDTWHHAVCVRSGTTNSMYIDGVLQAATVTEAFTSVPTVDFQVAYLNNGTEYWQGDLFDVRLYASAMSGDNVTWLYTFGVGGTAPSTPELRLNFDEGSGDTAFDSSGNGNDGTLTNSPTRTTQAIKSWANDEGCNHCLQFDGSESVEGASANGSDFTITGAVTIYAEINTDPGASASDMIVFGLGTGVLKCTFTIHNATKLYGYINGGANGVSFIIPTVQRTGWRSVALTFNATTDADGMRLYMDAVEVATKTSSSATTGITGDQIYIGDRSAGGNGYEGKIRNVRVFNGVKSAAEIATLHSGVNVEDGLVAWYKLNRPDIALDSHGDNHLAVNGASDCILPRLTGTNTDVSGRALEFVGKAPLHGQLLSPCGTFDGIDDYLDYGDVGAVGNVTVSAWVHFDTVSTNGIVSKFQNAAGGKSFFLYTAGGKLKWLVSTDGTAEVFINSGSTLNTGQWYHIVATYDGTTMKTFVDGVLDDSGTGASGSIHTTTSKLIVSGYDNTAHDFHGRIADLRVMDRAITNEEVLGLFRGDTPSSDDDIIHSPVCEKAGDTIHDISTNANHATLYNATLANFWANTQTKVAHGCNNGYRLDGSTLIPAQVGGLVAADGNAITNPPGFNGASTLDHDPYTVPKLDSANLNQLALPASHALGDGVTGLCLDLDAFGLYVDLGSQAIPSGDYTFSCWVNITAGTVHAYPIRWGDMRMHIVHGATLNLWHGASTIAWNFSDIRGGWHHLALKASGTTVEFFVDNISQGVETLTAVSSTSYASYIGRYSSSYLYGEIFDVRVFHEELSDADIATLYAFGEVANAAGWWKLNNPNGTAAEDVSGNGNDGTLVGDPAYTTQRIDSDQQFIKSSAVLEERFLLYDSVLTGGNLAKARAYTQ